MRTIRGCSRGRSASPAREEQEHTCQALANPQVAGGIERVVTNATGTAVTFTTINGNGVQNSQGVLGHFSMHGVRARVATGEILRGDRYEAHLDDILVSDNAAYIAGFRDASRSPAGIRGKLDAREQTLFVQPGRVPASWLMTEPCPHLQAGVRAGFGSRLSAAGLKRGDSRR